MVNTDFKYLIKKIIPLLYSRKNFQDNFSILKYLGLEFSLMIAVFSLIRLLFFLSLSDLWQEIPSGVIVRAFVNGLWFDSVIASYIFALPVLFSLIPFFNDINKKMKMVRKFFSIVLPIIYFIGIIDIKFFEISGNHLDSFALENLNHFGIVFTMIWEQYNVILYLLPFILLMIIFNCFRKKIFLSIPFSNKREFRLFDIGVFLILLLILFVGARGKITSVPINWGDAYFCNYEFANQLGLNGQFTAISSLLSHEKIQLSKDQLNDFRKTLKENFYIKSDSSLNFSNPLIRKIKGRGDIKGKPNIVFIVLESWRADMVGCLGDTFRVTPNFDSIAAKGALFENFYATGIRSNRGLLSILCSFPGYAGTSLLKKMSGNMEFPTIAAILKKYGYRDACFIYGGDPNFDNMKSFLQRNGFNRFIGINDFSEEEYGSHWGASDKAIFNKSVNVLNELKQPFISLIFTLTTHEPFTRPKDCKSVADPQKTNRAYFYDLMHYTDEALGNFFNKAANKSFYKNTIFVLVADHTKKFDDPAMSAKRFHIPAVIFSPKLYSKGKKIDTIASQTDIVPTVLSMMEGAFEINSWGTDILSKDTEKQFIHFNNNTWSTIKHKKGLLWLNLKNNDEFLYNSEGILIENVPDSLLPVFNSLCSLNKAINYGSLYYYYKKQIWQD